MVLELWNTNPYSIGEAIKTLEGEWQGFLRMRVGKIRIIFTVDVEQDELQIYDIGFRGNIYKT